MAIGSGVFNAKDVDGRLEEVSLQLRWGHGFQFAGYYAAIQQGYYRDAGLKVNLRESSLNADFNIANEVVSGRAEYGVDASRLLLDRLQGKPVVVLAAIFQHSPLILISLKSSNLNCPQDFIGHTVSVGTDASLRAMFFKEGVSIDQLQVSSSWENEDLIGGKIDGMSAYVTDQPFIFKERGVEINQLRPLTYGIDFYGDCLFTSERELKDHPDRVAAFREASLRGWNYAMSHVDEMVEVILAKYPTVRSEGALRFEAEEMSKVILPGFIETGHMNPGRWQHIADIYSELGMVSGEYDLEGFVYSPETVRYQQWQKNVLLIVLGVFLFAFAVLLFMTIFNRMLKVQVRSRTAELRQEIAEREKAEKALYLSEEKFRGLVETSSDWIWETDANGRYLYSSPQVESLLGYSPQELLGKAAFDLMVDSDVSRIRNVFEKAVRDRKPLIALENLNRHKDGRHVVMETSGMPVFNASGEVAGFRGIDRDITHRKQMEQELAATKEMLESAIEQFPSGIIIADAPDARIRQMNQAACQILGVDARRQNKGPDDIGSADWESFYPDGTPYPREKWPLMRAIHFGERTQGEEILVLNKNGFKRFVFVNAAPVRDVTGRIVAGIVVFHDVTEQKQAEKDRQELEDKLRQSEKLQAVGQLAGGIAHDFNNILQAILGFSELAMGRVDEDETLKNYIGQVIKAGHNATALVSQLLAFSRRQVLQMENLDLNEVVFDLIKMLGRVIGEHLSLKVVEGRNLGTVRADRGQLGQILTNLCVNARDAMPDGGEIVIETENVLIDDEYCVDHGWVKPGHYVLLSVTDSGNGIEPAIKEQIFEPFFTTKKEGQGTGLGLATVYGLVKQHGGTIEVYSELGKGTTFKIYLPVVERPAKLVGDKIQRPETGGTETILLAEDDETVRFVCRDMLEHAGYKVLTAVDGYDAKDKIADHADRIDLVLLDVVMPKCSGRVVYDWMKENYPEIPAIFTSGYSTNAIHTNFVLDEGVDLIQKPYNRTELLERIRCVLDR